MVHLFLKLRRAQPIGTIEYLVANGTAAWQAALGQQ
jgi:hypothetical protein